MTTRLPWEMPVMEEEEPLWEKVDGYHLAFDAFVVMMNALVFMLIIVRRRLRRDGFYWTVLALALSSLIRAVVGGVRWASRTLHGNAWNFGQAGCTAYYVSSDFFGVFWFLGLACLAVHLIVTMWQQNLATFKKSKTYQTISIILLLLPLIASASLVGVTAAISPARVSPNKNNMPVCRRKIISIATYVDLSSALLAVVMAFILVILTKICYRTAREFLGTILAVFFIIFSTALVDMFKYYVMDMSEQQFGIPVKVAMIWVKYTFSGWSALFWMFDSGTCRSLMCCKPWPRDEAYGRTDRPRGEEEIDLVRTHPDNMM
jgi:hypothetical protein